MPYEIDQGDDETLHLAVKSPDPNAAPNGVTWSATDTSTWGPLNLTGCKLWLYIRTNDGSAVISKTTDPGGGITVTDATAGLADVAIDHAETRDLDALLIGKTLRLEVQIRSAAGLITTLKRSTITILRDRLVE